MKAGIWQIEGLTVGALASRVKAPEHQMRKAINQVLGHRNFPGFTNGAQIEAAKEYLSASDATDASVLEIAYGVGFASFGPFNRAFRELTGLSPTDYRAPCSTRASSASCRPVCSACSWPSAITPESQDDSLTGVVQQRPTHVIGARRPCLDHSGDWARISEIAESGCVLVRPDHHVAWRAESLTADPVADLRRVLRQILAL